MPLILEWYNLAALSFQRVRATFRRGVGVLVSTVLLITASG